MIRNAKITDANDILRLIRIWADEGKMLHRSLNEIYENLRDFFVYEIDGKLVGAVALHVVWENLAEIRSLVVDKEYESRGVGSALVEKALENARELEISNIFVLTYVPDFFLKSGFSVMDKQELPHKIWSDCIRCHKFPDCDETAVSIKLA